MMTDEQKRVLALAAARKRLKAKQSAAPASPQQAYMEARAQGQMPAPVAMDNAQATKQAAIDARTNAVVRRSQADQAQAAATPQIGPMGAAVLGAGQGATFGLSDEIIAGMSALSPNQTYAEELPKVRAMMAAGQEQNPVTSAVSNIGGAIATAPLTASALGFGGAANLATRAAQGAATGAVEGGLYGFGSGEGGALNRAKGALTYGSLGAALGGAAPFMVEGARRGIDAAISGPIASMRSSPSQTRAGKAIVDALQRSGMSADDVSRATRQAQNEGQSEFMAVDAMGRSGQRLLSSIARTTPDATEEIANKLTARQATQGERLSRIVSDAMQAPETAAARSAALKKARNDAANVAYEAARKGAGPVDVRGVLSVIDDRIGPMQGSGVAGDGIDATLSKFRNRLAAKSPEKSTIKGQSGISERGYDATKTAVELSDFGRVLGVKRDIQDAIGAATLAGKNNEASELTGLVKELDSALEAASDGYRVANDEFAKASRVIDQIEAGKESARPMVRSEDVLSRYGKMTPDEQGAFRVGRAEPTLAQINSAAEGANKARPLTSGKTQSELGAMANDADLLKRQLARENVMFETNRKTLGGSETAERLADDTRISSETAGVIGNLLSGNLAGAAKTAGIQGMNALTGRNQETRKLIAQALMSGQLDDIIKPALMQSQRQGGQNKVIESIIRALPRASGQ